MGNTKFSKPKNLYCSLEASPEGHFSDLLSEKSRISRIQVRPDKHSCLASFQLSEKIFRPRNLKNISKVFSSFKNT